MCPFEYTTFCSKFKTCCWILHNVIIINFSFHLHYESQNSNLVLLKQPPFQAHGCSPLQFTHPLSYFDPIPKRENGLAFLFQGQEYRIYTDILEYQIIFFLSNVRSHIHNFGQWWIYNEIKASGTSNWKIYW